MPAQDTKITALTAIGANPINVATFPIPMVDLLDNSMAASGTTKKVTVNQILGAGGTATLASATITGNLTVDTTTLFVNSSNDRVGIGTVTPLSKLHVGSGTGLNNLGVGLSLGATANFYEAFDGTKTLIAGTDSAQAGVKVGSLTNHPLYLASNNTAQLEITHPGLFVFNDGAGGTRMTLNATGLGVGVAATAAKLEIGGADGTQFYIRSTGTNPARIRGFTNATEAGLIGFLNGGGIYFDVSGERMRIDSAGTFRVKGAGTAGSTDAVQFSGSAPASAMTLDTSGNLLVGTTDAGQTSGVGTKILGSGLGPYVVNAAIANSALAYTMYSTGAAAYRFYVGWAGTVFATNTTISAISDARLKENIQNLDVGLNEILALKPRKFDWKAGKGKDIKGDRGFIAQEFETVFPNLIDEWADPAPEGEAPYKSVRQDLIPVLVKAIQELAAEVNALKKA